MFDAYKYVKGERIPVDLDELKGAIFVDKWISADGYLVMEFKRGKIIYRVWID